MPSAPLQPLAVIPKAARRLSGTHRSEAAPKLTPSCVGKALRALQWDTFA